MPVNSKGFNLIKDQLADRNVTLVAVSKTKPVEDILEMYHLGQRDFGENYVQELLEKEKKLPGDIRWHFIGHLQTNKVKFIAPFVHLIHAVDSYKLLKEINKQAEKNKRVIQCLLQVHIAQEETKFGFNKEELENLISVNKDELNGLKHIKVAGLMGMASLTEDVEKIKNEFSLLKSLFDQVKREFALLNPDSGATGFSILSMGMTSDYKIAIEKGSTMIRIGSLIFGERNK
ncbi:MAG: YggS family pyridoxal phosphate-dependent enzyme [Bacteroidetes bacterium]|nr:YggS family pyridoxal phosphate-dependent enzyme [Bacteroidota bacterium]MBS1630992.1 YggS family pyridoxal phosphate-dependent enzyme [Bacteroidota bacterium]